jgi:glycosyltransferase involved in cell wall biosynthesis
VLSLNERYALLDQHMVIAEREGFGLPHVEAMACGVPTAAISYCSGQEVTQLGETGLLVGVTGYRIGTWGGARGALCDVADLARQLRWLYDHPAERAAMSARALAYGQNRTWLTACLAVEQAIKAALDKREKVGAA